MFTRRETLAGGAGLALAFTARAESAAADQSNAGAASPLSGAQSLSRAEQALGHNTLYAMGLPIDPAKPWPHANDCSGLILWCFGLTREHFKIGNTGSTNAIYADIKTGKGLFVQTREPRVGGIVIYRNFTLPGRAEDSGHVALIKSLRLKDNCAHNPASDPLWEAGPTDGIEEKYPLEIYDCSSTSWWTYGDAVRAGDYSKFLLHDQLMVMTAKAAANDLSVKQPILPRPIYAVIRGEEKLPFVPPQKLGHCPGR